MYALVEYKGKQYKAEKGAVLAVDKIDAEKGSVIDMNQVLLVSDGDNVQVGAPYVKGVAVKAVVEDTYRDRKIIVLKYKSKKDYRRTIGHRQGHTRIRIEDIVVA
ncbi:MAG: 50S ribosomal protein L21 [Spirochaetaceae bacterium]|jgi:large subunit ribosomal protein L21|nr:50S ribosomal protein L21 [Spirochaetaceae bacterium]